jgi:hypothetical protein
MFFTSLSLQLLFEIVLLLHHRQRHRVGRPSALEIGDPFLQSLDFQRDSLLGLSPGIEPGGMPTLR